MGTGKQYDMDLDMEPSLVRRAEEGTTREGTDKEGTNKEGTNKEEARREDGIGEEPGKGRQGRASVGGEEKEEEGEEEEEEGEEEEEEGEEEEEDLWDTLTACRRKVSACEPGLSRSYMEYELNYIDDQLCYLKQRMDSFLASADGENEKRGRELRQENSLFLRYLIIKEYFFGRYEPSRRSV
jgi:hypothetical protein